MIKWGWEGEGMNGRRNKKMKEGRAKAFTRRNAVQKN